MPSYALIIARKEIVESLRDVRSLISGFMYALMGPATSMLVCLAMRHSAHSEARTRVLFSMMTIFTLVSAFVGGMSVAIDTVAGERERRSLLPLLINPVSRLDVVLGKWLATSLFTVLGLVANLIGCGVILAMPFSSLSLPSVKLPLVIAIVFGLFPLALLAAGLELLISASSRTTKEAHTYLSALVFVPLAIGMGITFLVPADTLWLRFFPVAGQQLLLQDSLGPARLHLLGPTILAWITGGFTLLVILHVHKMFQRDDVIYGH